MHWLAATGKGPLTIEKKIDLKLEASKIDICIIHGTMPFFPTILPTKSEGRDTLINFSTYRMSKNTFSKYAFYA